MKFMIRHEIAGRIRVHMFQERMSCREADMLMYYLHQQRHVTAVKVYERTSDVTVSYVGGRQEVLD